MSGEYRKVEDDDLQEAKQLFKEGLRKIFQAAKKASEKVVEGFREGYAEDVTKKEKWTPLFPNPLESLNSHFLFLNDIIRKPNWTAVLNLQYPIKLVSKDEAKSILGMPQQKLQAAKKPTWWP